MLVKKWWIICIICINAAVLIWKIPQNPKIISSITTLDTAYLTILVDKSETKNVKKLEKKILQMCREDAFEEIKLNTEDRPLAQKLYIFVYISEADLKTGKPFLVIKNDAGD